MKKKWNKAIPAKGADCVLHWDGLGYFVRVYDKIDRNVFKDYEIAHSDLSFTITDDDAFFYEDDDGHCVLDHSLETLGETLIDKDN